MKNRFKVGDMIECIDNIGPISLIEGDKYHVSNCAIDAIMLEGYSSLYNSTRFKLAFTQEYFSALNEKDAEKYIGRDMEFLGSVGVRKHSEWIQKTFIGYSVPDSPYPFVVGDSCYAFMRTCPETFKKKMVTKTVVGWLNIYDDGEQFFHASKWEANDNGKNRVKIACVKLTGKYEVEE